MVTSACLSLTQSNVTPGGPNLFSDHSLTTSSPSVIPDSPVRRHADIIDDRHLLAAMALVDYSSSSSGDGDDPIPSPAKRHKGRVETVEPGQAGGGADRPKGGSGAEKERNVTPSKKTSDSDMPPLPEAFHDLYASTVRQSVVDDPSLHQGRKRLTPHVVGNWPSHLYVECKLLQTLNIVAGTN